VTAAGVVLLVEDDETDVLFLTRAFEKIGMDRRIEVAGSGRAAMEYLAGRPPYADRARFPRPTHVILDLKLPETPGLAVLEWIRSEPNVRDLEVAVLTSSQQESDIRLVRSLGVTLYLVKPMGFAALVEVARQLADWMLRGGRPAP
jgi:CheY-like chemotaxis protein